MNGFPSRRRTRCRMRHRTLRGVLALVWAALLLTGCSPAPTSPGTPVPSAAPAAALVGAWRAERVRAVTLLATDAAPTLAFGYDGHVTGRDECRNALDASYETSGSGLRFGTWRTSLIGCAVDDGFTRALEAVTSARLAADRLELLDAKGDTVLVLVRTHASALPVASPSSSAGG